MARPPIYGETMQHRLHIVLDDETYAYLLRISAHNDASLSATVRKIIASQRRRNS